MITGLASAAKGGRGAMKPYGTSTRILNESHFLKKGVKTLGLNKTNFRESKRKQWKTLIIAACNKEQITKTLNLFWHNNTTANHQEAETAYIIKEH